MPYVSPDLSVADELEFESWPEEQQKLAFKYVVENIDKFRKEGIYFDSSYNVGYEQGKIDGRAIAEARRG